MPHTDIPADLRAQIDAISTPNILLHSEISGSYDLKTSLNTHFNQAFGANALFSNEIRDWELQTALTRAFEANSVKKYFNDFLKRAPGTPVSIAACAYFYRTLAERVVNHSAAIPQTELTDSAPTSIPYSVCSLAQTLWARKACLTERDSFLAAAFLRFQRLPSEPLLPRPPAPTLELGDYLSMPVLMKHLLAPPKGVSTVVQLFNTLGASVYFYSHRYRAPTARERAAGFRPNQYGKVFFPGAALHAPAAQVLDALLHSRAFDEWAQHLANAVEWSTSSADAPQYLALAEQAMVDVIYPPNDRRAGYILDFELFNPDNAHIPLSDIRLDLINSVQASLDCIPGIAELAGELLMRRFAPELLLEAPFEDFVYQPDIRWANLRQGAMVLLARQQTHTFDRAEQVFGQATQGDDAALNKALGDTLALWAQLKGIAELPPPWSARQWQRAYDCYLVALDQEGLRDLPDRFAEARRLLRQIGISPEERNIDKQLHLEAYLHFGAGYRQTSLPDATTLFEAQFTLWTQQAASIYEGIFQRFLLHLPQDDQDRLRDDSWTCHAVTWPFYKGPVEGAIPSFGDSPSEDWHMETATLGLLIHVPGQYSDTLYELFPERLEWRTHVIAPTRPQRLGDKLLPAYRDYNETALPWEVANWPQLHKLIDAPATDRLQALTKCYANSVALGNCDALRALGRGATPHERFLAESRKTPLDRYLLKLFSNLVPLVGCLDVQSGLEALSCGADALGVSAVGIKVGGRLIKPLTRLHRTVDHSSRTTFLNTLQAAKRWAGEPLPTEIYHHVTRPRRWHSAPELTIQQRILPGQTPDALVLERVSAPNAPQSWEVPSNALLISRDANTLDAIIDGTAYRYRLHQPDNLARRLQHEPLLTASDPVPEPSPYSDSSIPDLTLRFAPPSNDAGTPPFGQYASRAFQTSRIEPAPIRYRPQGANKDSIAHVLVFEGKVHSYTRGAQKPLKRLSPLDTQVTQEVLLDPCYLQQISAELSAELRLGLPDDLPIDQITEIAIHCPPVRLGKLTETVSDRRTLRAALISWNNKEWMVVEADSGIFYGAPYQGSDWLQMQINRLQASNSAQANLPFPPESARWQLNRITENEAIERYLEVSETYRIVATRPNLQRDVENLTTLLRDWIEYSRKLESGELSQSMGFLLAQEASMLPEYAKNILTQTPPQNALAGLVRSGVVGLNREIIPAWGKLDTNVTERQHILGILNKLLSGVKSEHRYKPMTAVELLSEDGGRSLRKYLSGGNLAFARVTLRDNRRLVYFSMSGGKRHQIVIPAPEDTANPSIRYIDARAAMQQPIDERFTELPMLRSSGYLHVKAHRRHLDSERLVASTLNRELLAQSDTVTSIEVFTLFSPCRSCGGFVLPRLRLDYPKARFSVTWLQDYSE